MSAKTKIVVVKAKELIYTALFICLAIVLIFLLIIMFAPDKKTAETMANVYQPGIYTSTIQLGNTPLDVAVTVDKDQITAVTINNLSDSITTMYPLLQPSLEQINEQLKTVHNIDELSLSGDNQYTTFILQQAIKNALSKANSQK